ncbi:MAG: TonB family protein [Deltaproteobacteria bacterium]|nr:TonB family protein [Deltaproteobacteria bacterium]
MNGDPGPDSAGFFCSLDSRQQRFFRIGLLLSVALHIAGLLTSPYWQSRPATPEDFLQVDIAEIPSQELPKIPMLPVEKAPPPPPAAHVGPGGAPPAPSPVPSREAIREKVAKRGILRMLARERGGDAGADPLSGIKIPREIRVASKGAQTVPYNPASGGEDPAKVGRAPGIGKQVATAPRASRVLSSQVFRTDSGLDAEISGGIDDENRTTGAIASRVSSYRSGIRYAYNRELLKNPSLSGKIVVSFVIRPDGSVESPEIRQSGVNWPALDDAVVKKIAHWKFPKSRGTAVRVVFPFVFHPEM